MKITKETIKNVGRVVGTVVLYGAAFVAPRVLSRNIDEVTRYGRIVRYSDAVSAIMNSGMFSDDKSAAVAMLCKDKDTEYYRAVIRIVESSMFSSDKVKTIANIYGEES